MAAALPRCQALVQKCYDDPSNAAVCLSANQYCEATLTERYYETGRNPYDFRRFGPYAEEKQVAFYLNRWVLTRLDGRSTAIRGLTGLCLIRRDPRADGALAAVTTFGTSLESIRRLMEGSRSSLAAPTPSASASRRRAISEWRRPDCCG